MLLPLVGDYLADVIANVVAVVIATLILWQMCHCCCTIDMVVTEGIVMPVVDVIVTSKL